MKIIFRFISLSVIILISFICYLSFVGLETKKFNEQIVNKIKKIDDNFKIELKEIKIILDPFKFKLQAKTIGPKIINKNKIIEIESIKTQIPLQSLFNQKFLIENLEISTKTLQIKNLISFIRVFNKQPELFFLEKFINKGFLIADIKLNFDSEGNLKNDYEIIGLVKDFKINFFKKYELNKLSFIFDYNLGNLNVQNLDLFFNDLNFYSNDINFKKLNKNISIKGDIENKILEINDENIELLIKPYFSNFNLNKLKFASKNIFSFDLSEKFQLNNLSFKSDIEINELSLLNNFKIEDFFPKIKKNIKLTDYKVNIDYNDRDFIVNGNGAIQLQNNKDQIQFSIDKKKKNYDFKASIKIKENPILIDSLNYKKDENSEALINFNGKKIFKGKTIFNLIQYKEKDNLFKIKDLIFNNNFKIVNLAKFEASYLDNENNKNIFKVTSKKNYYQLKSPLFNASKLIDNIIDDDTEKKFIKENFKINIQIDKLLLDEKNFVKKFKGDLIFKNSEIMQGNLTGFFSKNEKLIFTVKSIGNEKITTLFLDKAETIVSRYKFIKGFNEGVLDFYSTKKDKESNSTLKIYDFKLKELPALTKLLTLASLQGIADILSGEGIRFNEFEMNFKNLGSLMTINEIYAIGPSISILMDGYVEKNKLISLRGTLVPATTLNKVIGSIPFLGDILVGKKTGEGVFGVSFKIKGPPKTLETTVNPIKTLTPRFITRTIEKIKKN